MEEIEMKKRPGRPKKYDGGAGRTIYVDQQEYEEISTEAEKQGMSFFEFMSVLYRVYARDNNREILSALKELKETKKELESLKRENQDLSDKLAKRSSQKGAVIELDKDTMISEAIDKMDEIRPRFEADIRLSQNGDLSKPENQEILKNRRELFRARKTEYMKIKNKLEAAGIHDIDARISDFDALTWSSQKALGISADKDDKNSIIFLKGEKKSPYIENGHKELKPELNIMHEQNTQKDSVKVLSFGEGGSKK